MGLLPVPPSHGTGAPKSLQRVQSHHHVQCALLTPFAGVRYNLDPAATWPKADPGLLWIIIVCWFPAGR